MKKIYCSFCREKKERLLGVSNYPDSYAICVDCVNRYTSRTPAALQDTCCFCGALDTTGFEETEATALICVECLAKFKKESEEPEQNPAEQNAIAEISIEWPVYFDAAMDLISVKVRAANGTLWSANFTTPPRVTWEMEKGKRTGEWVSGSYFCHPHLIFVQELTEDLIRASIEDLSKKGLLELTFRKD